MNALVRSFENSPTATARTANGARTLPTSGAKCVDLFATLGSIQNEAQAVAMFSQAYAEDKKIATAVALWGRDVRGGAGRRAAFRAILKHLETTDFDVFARVIARTPELGRWDDVLVAQTDEGRAIAYGMVARALVQKDRLCAKWMPRKATQEDNTAARLREFMGLTPKQYRKLIVTLTDVVESKMCARQWDEIAYAKIPSVAASRYSKAFKKRDGERYQGYLDSLKKDPTAKMNVSALYPHDLYRAAMSGGQDDYATAAWTRMDLGIPEGTNILPLIDVSGSMDTRVSGSVTAMDIAISLGMFLSEKCEGAFQNRSITFESNPRWCVTDPKQTLRTRFTQIKNQPWGGSTDVQKAFELILKAAVSGRVPQSDMPSHMLILSDMEFNVACRGDYYHSYRDRATSENYAEIERKFKAAGYDLPKIIFWNLNGRAGNSPVQMLESGTAMVSGFSPAILKSVVSQKTITPLDVMLDTVMQDKYNVFDA